MNLAAWRAWFALCPLRAAAVDMTSRVAVDQGRTIAILKLPVAVQTLYLKLPPESLRSILTELEALERGFPAGHGKVHATFSRDETGEWKWTHLRSEPPQQTITRGPGMRAKPRFTTTGHDTP
jgi:hypothetical protein